MFADWLQARFDGFRTSFYVQFSGIFTSSIRFDLQIIGVSKSLLKNRFVSIFKSACLMPEIQALQTALLAGAMSLKLLDIMHLFEISFNFFIFYPQSNVFIQLLIIFLILGHYVSKIYQDI